MGFASEHTTASAVLVLIVAWLGKHTFNLVQHRRRFKNLPGPPHHPIFGHLKAIGDVTQKLPKMIHPHVFALEVKKAYKLPSIFYMDIAPFGPTILYVMDPDQAAAVTSDPAMWKHPAFAEHLGPISGWVNLLLSDGPVWKKQRAVFNPGFAPQHIMSQASIVIDVTEEYVRALDRRAAANQVFRLEEEATKVTVDIIGRIVLDHDFQSFTTQNDFVQSLRKALSWMPDTQSFNPFHRFNPLRPLAYKYYKRRMDIYIGNVLDERFNARDPSLSQKARKKSGIDLALEAWFKESGLDVDARTKTMDPEFRQSAIDNMLVLLFAGHDTTASTICYCHHMLSQHPGALARLRQELDDVFGAGVNAAEKMRQDPHIINKCEYMAAVIKETLRLWSPGTTIRQGTKDYFLKHPETGELLPTEGLMVWPVLSGTHRDEALWGPTAHLFDPFRFLPPLSENIIPNAYRPFEKGPRNCIGQELANVEIKIALALTVREFDIRAAYDELDSLKYDGSMWASWQGGREGLQTYYGDEMYQVLMASAKPREGMPARIVRRSM